MLRQFERNMGGKGAAGRRDGAEMPRRWVIDTTRGVGDTRRGLQPARRCYRAQRFHRAHTVARPPQAHSVVRRNARDLLAIGRELGGVHDAVMAVERQDAAAAERVAYLHRQLS